MTKVSCLLLILLVAVACSTLPPEGTYEEVKLRCQMHQPDMELVKACEEVTAYWFPFIGEGKLGQNN